MIRLGLEDYRPPPREQRDTITIGDFKALASFLAPPSVAGVNITEHTALNLSAYFNGVDIISGQIGITPLIPYRRLADDERERATSHPTYRLLKDQPNPYMTPAVFWQTLVAHILTWGNGYAEIEFDRALRPIALWPVTPDKIEARTEVVTVAGGATTTRVYYVYQGQKRIEYEDMLHVPGLGYDGVRGYSVIAMARRSLGVSVAAENYGASFFGNGAWPGVLLEHPGKLSDTARDRLKASWDQLMRGPDRAHSTAVLEEGMKAKKIGIPPDDAQFMGTREFGVVEIARWLNLPPHKLKHKYGERPGGNLEAAQTEFLTDTLDPWYVRIAQECNRKLFPESQRSTFYVEHLVESRLRLDAKTRLKVQRGYFDMGVLSAEQIAKQQNLPAPKPKEEPPPPAPPPPQDEGQANAERALVVDQVGRFMRMEADRVRKAARKGPAEFAAAVDTFYQEGLPVLRGYLVSAVRVSLARRGVQTDPDKAALALAAAYVERSKEELLELPAKDLVEQADRLAASWSIMRALEMAEKVLALRADAAHAAPPAVVNVDGS